MKTRLGFVSNSSSASFTVSLDRISARDADILLNYPSWAAQNDGDDWSIYKDEERGLITGYTIMDNCNLSDYIRANNIDESLFHFGE